MIRRKIDPESQGSTRHLTREHPVHNRTPILLRFEVMLPSVWGDKTMAEAGEDAEEMRGARLTASQGDHADHRVPVEQVQHRFTATVEPNAELALDGRRRVSIRILNSMCSCQMPCPNRVGQRLRIGAEHSDDASRGNIPDLYSASGRRNRQPPTWNKRDRGYPRGGGQTCLEAASGCGIEQYFPVAPSSDDQLLRNGSLVMTDWDARVPKTCRL